jgi:hypothetical protein
METAKMPHKWQVDPENVVFIYNKMEFYSATKENEILSFSSE